MTEDYLKKAISSGRFSHAYIISGENENKREELAYGIAKILLCEKGTACGICHSCKQMAAASHPDLIRVTHEKPQTLSVREVREQICDTVDIRPYQSERKVYIVPDSQMMNENGQNAILKTIEEPPEYIVILLLTDNEKKLLETIRSRCVTLRQESGERNYDLSDMDDQEFLQYARDLYHDVLLYKETGDRGTPALPDKKEEIKKLAGALEFEDIEKVLDAIDKAEKRLSMSINPEITMSLLQDVLHIER